VLRELREYAGYAWLALWSVSRSGHSTFLAEETALEAATAAELRDRATPVLGAIDDPRLIPNVDNSLTLAAVPLTDDGRPVGLLAAVPRELVAFDAAELSFLSAVGTHLAPTLDRFQLQLELEARATLDATTGLDNRASFHQRLEDALARCGTRPVSILIIGVDHFKQINDFYGHAVGDELLQQVGNLISAQLADGQHVARFTSDEFAVIAPNVARTDVFTLAERLRISIGTKLLTAAEQVEQLSVSIGIATYPDDAGNADRLVLAAGHALLLAKQAGRNQVYQSNEAFAELASAHGRITDLLRQAPKETLTLLVRAMDQRLPERAGHAQRVARVADELGRELGLSYRQLVALRIAALVHDVGMYALPDALLRKPGRLSAVERELLAGTPLAAHQLLSQIELPPSVLPAVVHQHERWDGDGYPSRLAGAAIPLAARIIAVADAYDALTSARAHREQMSIEAALDTLRLGAGTQFDPGIVDAAVRLKGVLPDAELTDADEIGASIHHALQLVEA
jgi:diguanylate cyclase (GGDEF)-like protein